MRVFILEDDPSRIRRFQRALAGNNVTMTDNVPDAISKYDGPYDVVCLDHDLGGQVFVPSEHPNTGYAFAKWLADSDKKSPVIVHSMNPPGAERMVQRLGSRAVWEPFGEDLLAHLRGAAE